MFAVAGPVLSHCFLGLGFCHVTSFLTGDLTVNSHSKVESKPILLKLIPQRSLSVTVMSGRSRPRESQPRVPG